jgi:hypothetical protein
VFLRLVSVPWSLRADLVRPHQIIAHAVHLCRPVYSRCYLFWFLFFLPSAGHVPISDARNRSSLNRSLCSSSFLGEPSHAQVALPGCVAAVCSCHQLLLLKARPVWFDFLECRLLIRMHRYCSWAIGSKTSRFPSSNQSETVVFWTRMQVVRWNVCDDMNLVLARFLSPVSHVFLLALIRGSAVVTNSVPRVNSCSIAIWSWSC